MNADGIYLKVTLFYVWVTTADCILCQRSLHIYQRYINADCNYVRVTLTADYTIIVPLLEIAFVNLFTQRCLCIGHWIWYIGVRCWYIHQILSQTIAGNRNTGRKTTDLPHVTDDFCHIKLYKVPTPCHRQELNIQGYGNGV